MLQNFKYQIILHFIVFIWGFTAILGNYISLDSYALVWYRMGIAFLSLVVFAFISRRNLFQLNRKQFLTIIGIGCIVGLHWITFFGAIKVSSVSIAIIAMSSSTFFMALLEPIFFKRKIRIYEVLLSIAIMGGIFAIQQVTEKQISTEQIENTSEQFNTQESNLENEESGLNDKHEVQVGLGITLALISSFLATLFTVLNGLLVSRIDSFKITTWEMLGGFILLTVTLFLMGGFTAERLTIQGNELIALLILSIICTSFAFLASIWVMKFVAPFTVAISVNMEPIYAIILAIILYPDTETMSIEFYIGALVIISAVFLNAFFKSKFSSK